MKEKEEKKLDKGKEKPAEQQSIILNRPQEAKDRDKGVTEKKEEPLKSTVANDIGEIDDNEFEKTMEKEIERNKREDEKEFLKRIGFKEQEKNGKTQFSKWVDEGVIIGITYNNANPNGRIWGFRDNKPINTDELKEMDEFKQFTKFRRGEVKMPELPAVPSQEGIQKAQETGFKPRGRMYKVGDHEEPDSGLAQQWGNQAKISLRIMEPTEQTSDYAKAVVRATLPDGQYIEECIIHYFDVSRERIVFETIEKMLEEKKKPIEGFDDEGRPILTPEAKYRAYKRFIKFKDFAIRDAITKAGRRAILKLLNREWREPEEIEAEEQEVKMVHKW